MRTRVPLHRLLRLLLPPLVLLLLLPRRGRAEQPVAGDDARAIRVDADGGGEHSNNISNTTPPPPPCTVHQRMMSRMLSTMLGLPRAAVTLDELTSIGATPDQPFRVASMLAPMLEFPEDPADMVMLRLLSFSGGPETLPTGWRFTDMLAPSAKAWMGFTGRYDLSPRAHGGGTYDVLVGLPGWSPPADDVPVHSRLLQVAHSDVGLPAGARSPRPCGTITCRHVFMLTLLFGEMRRAEAVDAAAGGVGADGGRGGGEHSATFATALSGSLRVIEIGGGFGNMAWMVRAAFGFRSWSILDMDFCTKFQEYFLRENEKRWTTQATLPSASSTTYRRFGPESVWGHEKEEEEEEEAEATKEEGTPARSPVVEFVPAKLTQTWFMHGVRGRVVAAGSAPPDPPYVLIATHSWSELPFEAFCGYLSGVLSGRRRVEWILYATQVEGGPNSLRGSGREHARKLALLRRSFVVVREVRTMEGRVANLVLRRKAGG